MRKTSYRLQDTSYKKRLIPSCNLSSYRQGESGVTLVLVLAILTILTLLGVSFTFVMRTEMQAAGNYAAKLQADYLAELGVTAAKNRLMSERTDSKGKLTHYSGFTSKSLGINTENGEIIPIVTVEDEEAKLNLSVALDTTHKDDWKWLSAENFLYARFSTMGITHIQATTVLNKMVSAYQSKQLKSMDDLRNTIGNSMYHVLMDYVTFNSYETNVDLDNKQRVNINSATPQQIYDKIKNVIGKENAARLSVSIVDFRDNDNIPSLLTVEGITYRGIEMTPYINEVMPWSKTPDDKGDDGIYVEFYNPYHDDIQIDGWRLTGSFGSLDLYGTVPSQGYFILTNQYADDPDLDGGEADGNSYQIHYGSVANENLVEDPVLYLSKDGDTLKLYDDKSNLVDEFTYGSSSKDVAWEKNDPRVNILSEYTHGTPYEKNYAYQPPSEVIDEENIAYVANVSFKSIGDLCFVNQVSPESPWTTLKLSEDTSSYSLGSIIDYLTVTDDRDKLGAININTAPYEVLISLPGVNKDLVNEIIKYRNEHGAFTKISQLINVSGMNKPVDSKTENTVYSTDLEEKTINFRKLSNWVTVRSYNFTIDSYARLMENKKLVGESRIMAIVNRSGSPMVTVMEKRLIP